ncbi:hypothetical protein [uncultured Anaerovibrio sp.]|uniref:hypothetical protein n=1 Tax=uncultured Anaerovibrio sp. TaxID=361586 RepID=UPI0025F4373B|nr:hypothetical protein [uncultured Anaerovibrio sp.]
MTRETNKILIVKPLIGQIVTTRRTIMEFIWDIQASVTHNTVYLISKGLVGEWDYLRLLSVCARLYYLSKLVYRDKAGVKKLSAAQYRKQIFDSHAETQDEINAILHKMYKEHSDERLNDDNTDLVGRCLMIIEKLWCTSIACAYEQIYIPELAYAFEYVVKRRGELPEPVFRGASSLFPDNYENYNYSEGIAEYFEDVMGSIF